MKNYWFLACFSIFFQANAQIITPSPRVEKQSTRDTRISKVEISQTETVLHIIYRQTAGMNGGVTGDFFGNRLFFDSPRSRNTVSINPQSYLKNPENGKKYRFVRASGIPVLPQERSVQDGETIRFIVAYEPLEAGVELIDLFEGRNDGNSSRQYWNFYGIEVNNPAKSTEEIAEEKLPDVRPKNVPQAMKPTRLVLKGKVFDAKTEKPISGKIVYRLQENKIDSVITDGSGVYSFTLSPNAYSYEVSAKGYVGTIENIDLSRMKAGQFTQNIYLNPLAVNEVIPLENIKFEVSKSNLLAESYAELDKLVTMMKENPSMAIRLEGHTDNVGEPAKNKSLSIDRVFGVRQYLIKKGIEGKRVQFVGHGDTKPIADNSTEAGRSQNRRVEMVILSN